MVLRYLAKILLIYKNFVSLSFVTKLSDAAEQILMKFCIFNFFVIFYIKDKTTFAESVTWITKVNYFSSF